MYIIADKIAEVLSSDPDPILSLNSINVKKPAGSGELPSIILSLTAENKKGNWAGDFIRSGNSIVKNTSIVEVRSEPDRFSEDLKSYYLKPLPLKKNPSSARKEFSGNDVHIKNIADESNSFDYVMKDDPVTKEEFRLDVSRAQIIFGQSQTEGEKLEIVHWTITWRDDIEGKVYNGSIFLEIWADNDSQSRSISRTLQDKLASSRSLTRQKGFLNLQPVSLEPMENIIIDPPIGSSFRVWKQKISYAFIFEHEEGGELSSGIPIERIDVDIDENLAETFSIKK